MRSTRRNRGAIETMHRRTFLSAGAMTLCPPLLPVWGEKEQNAAEYYRKAFGLVPELTQAENELVESLPATPFSSTGWNLVKRSQSALRELTRAAALEDCDWGSDYFAKFLDSDTLPISKVSQLTRLVCLRASYSFQQNNSSAAIDDLATAIKIGRHIGRRGPWMATILQFSIENLAIDVAAAHLPQQNEKALKALAVRLQTLPKSSTLNEAMQGEKEFLLQSIRQNYQNKTSKEAFELLRKDLCL